jgi:hypothetical protein
LVIEYLPVFFQGKVVAHVRKYDSRLQIEMLRAHMPKVFKTPGAKVAINNAGQITNNTMIVDAEERNRLITLRQESLRRIADQRRFPLPVETVESRTSETG